MGTPELKKLVKGLSDAQMVNVLQLFGVAGKPEVIPAHAVMAVVLADMCRKAGLLTDSEVLLILTRFKPHFEDSADRFERIVGGELIKSKFQFVLINPWSEHGCATCTGCADFVNTHTGERLSKLPEVAIVTLSVHCDMLLMTAITRLRAKPA